MKNIENQSEPNVDEMRKEGISEAAISYIVEKSKKQKIGKPL